MEKEQIIKVLESIVGEEEVFCEVCPYKAAYCNRLVLCDTLALIKELTEEIKKLTSINISKDIIIEGINEVIKQLIEENETLKDKNEHLAVFLAEVKADTMREMQTRFAMHFGTYRPTDVVKVTEVFKLLKKISGEMLYEEEEEEDK